MMFRRISYALALQFTGFVFLLLLVTGAIFLAGDVAQRRNDAEFRLQRQLTQILSQPKGARSIPALPTYQRQRIRIVDSLGKVLFAGSLYDGIPFKWQRRLVTMDIGGEEFDILTAPYVEEGEVVGYLQVADRTPRDDLESRVFLFLVVSAGISALTFAVGLFFAKRSLKPAERMLERLEQFTQDASHELRTPLTAVGTSLDLALATGDNKELIRSAKKDLKDMGQLVERLLELARLDSFVLNREHADMSALVESALEGQVPAAETRGIALEKSIEANVHQSADPSLARQVVANLVSNAIKFGTKKVTVTLTKESLSVHDDGKGISSEALPKIFDRFFREDSARSTSADGLGLGLALVKRICDLHEWTVGVESDAVAGTTFTVRF